MLKVKTKVETITKNTILQADDFGGWQAVNVGDTAAIVNGVTIKANGAVVGVDYTTLRPDVIWDEPINIYFTETGTNPCVIVTRLKYIEQ